MRQDLKLTQQLVMTPQLQQAIKLLQLSRTELIETVHQALQENPLLEERQEREDPGDLSADTSGDNSGREDSGEAFSGKENDLAQTAEWEDYLGVFSSSSKTVKEREMPEDNASLEAMASAKPSLESHLSWQLHLSNLSPSLVRIGEIIIRNLDSDGYLGLSLEEAASLTECTPSEVEEALREVQRLDPVGAGSRSLEECLARQLENLGYEDRALFSLVRDYLGDLDKPDKRSLAGKLGISREQLEEYLHVLRELDPRPGSGFGGGETVYVQPDVYVYNYNGEFVILLNDDGLPDLGLNPHYLEILPEGSKKDREYLQDKMREAMWLIKSIHQRQRTLYRVMESIVRFQRGFFQEGVNALRPMVLRDVAEDIEVHESTVSRVTANKFVSTPFGIFEMKFFFSSGLGTENGGQMSAVSVKNAIKNLIQEEDPQRPLSDKKIVEYLNNNYELQIARRTVAKYREAQGIPSSSRRKRVGTA